LPENELQRRIFELKREVDIAYLLKVKEYRKYFFKLLEIILAKFVFMLSMEKRHRIKLFVTKILSKNLNRGVKRSNHNVEKFAHLQMELLKKGALE
jgi:hypothetical protein